MSVAQPSKWRFTFNLFIWASAILLAGLIGCDEVRVKPKASGEDPSTQGDSAFSGQYTKDGKGGLFNNIKWYHYDIENHLVWPLYDVYQVKTPSSTYKIQISEYYGDSDSAPGIFAVQIQSGSAETTLRIEAQGCGNPFTNPDFEACLKDPNQNVFTYLDLETLTLTKWTDDQAQNEFGWDMAFKGTDMKLNSGTSGPSSVVGALLKRFDFFFDGRGQASVPALIDKANIQNAKDAFFNVEINPGANYFLPDGIDRVVHESYWLVTEKDGHRSVDPSLWWIVQSKEQNAYAKFHFLSLQQVESETSLKLEYYWQGPIDETFAKNSKVIELRFSQEDSEQKIKSLCFDFGESAAGPCAQTVNWQLQLLIKDSDWRIRTVSGGLGPYSKIEADAIESGRPAQRQ